MGHGATVRDTGPRRRFYDSVSAQTLLALPFNAIGLFAGVVFSLLTPQLREAPWILALYPPILTFRGNIGGILSGNLTTMLHLGLVRPRIRRNTEIYNSLITTTFVINFMAALIMGVASFALNFLFRGASLDQFFIYLCVPTVSCTLTAALTMPITSLVGMVVYRRGLDPDILVYPILSSVNDLVVTSSFVAIASTVISGGTTLYLLGALFIATMLISMFFAWRNRRVEFFSKTFREGTAIIIFSSLFGSVNGVFLSRLSHNIMRNPGLVILYPALIDTLGDIGSIVGSMTTTNLALGYVRTLGEEVRGGLRMTLQVETVAALMHVAYGVVAYVMAGTASHEASLPFLAGVALASNLLSFLVISLFALVVAFLAFKRGLNPDNVVIPAITSTSDTVATLSLIPAITVLKLIGL